MSGRPAIFLDRDGTLIVERHYLADPEGVEFTPGTPEALRRLAQAGYAIVLVTNQSGIGRGMYSLEDFHAVQERIRTRLEDLGVHIEGVYYCPHHPDEQCECRKPGLALFQRAAAELGLDLAASIYIGDRLKDIEPAASLGGRAFLVLTGYGEDHAPQAAAGVTVVRDVADAAERILKG